MAHSFTHRIPAARDTTVVIIGPNGAGEDDDEIQVSVYHASHRTNPAAWVNLNHLGPLVHDLVQLLDEHDIEWRELPSDASLMAQNREDRPYQGPDR